MKDRAVGGRSSVLPEGVSEASPVSVPNVAEDVAGAEGDLSLHVTQRMLLSALREQDAAVEAEAARGRAQFLAEASLRFGATLDEELTHATIARLALPPLWAWCVVDIVDAEGKLRRLAVVQPDGDTHVAAPPLIERWAPRDDDPIGIPAVARERIPVVIAAGVAPTLLASMRDPDVLRVLHLCGAGAVLVVPILGHDTLLGAITYVSRPHTPAYSTDDIRLAEALAERCGQALENARLYAAARAAWALSERLRVESDSARADAERARAVAESANAAKVNFLHKISHEFRTPLNAIGGYAQLLAMAVRGPVTPAQEKDLASIQRAQVHLLSLVDEVLEYAQVRAGHLTYVGGKIALAEVVAGVHTLVAPQMEAKHLTYSFDPGEQPFIVFADPTRVRQIMLNLLANATKFTASGGRISVVCAAADGSPRRADGSPALLAVCVRDSGVGIPTSQHDAVFEAFVQVDRALTSVAGGVGLGLPISRELARGMGGDITVTSEVGIGSSFTLTLPAA